MKLLERLLYEPQHAKDEQVTDKALTRSVVVSVVGILVCMACLFGLTWAWFSDSVVATSNKITAATFDLNITVVEQGTANTVEKGEDGYYTLNENSSYSITLTKQGEAKSGFCLLSVKTSASDIATPYYTDAIPQITTAQEIIEPFVFTVSGVSKIKFTAMWGQYPEDRKDNAVHYNDTLSFGVAAITPPTAEQNEATQAAQTTVSSDTDPKQSESATGTEKTDAPKKASAPEAQLTELPADEQSKPTESTTQTESTEP